MSKHTPGPWFACCKSKKSNHSFVFANCGEKNIASIDINDKSESDYNDMSEEVTKEEAMYNAHLIENAPDMLDALKLIVSHSEGYNIDGSKRTEFSDTLAMRNYVKVIETIKGVIKKAQGDIEE